MAMTPEGMAAVLYALAAVHFVAALLLVCFQRCDAASVSGPLFNTTQGLCRMLFCTDPDRQAARNYSGPGI
jgi:hypothetical protein